MQYRFYTTSEEAWEGMREAMVNAEKSIYLETYLFRNTTPGFNLIDIFKKKAEKGVKIKLVVDGLSVFYDGNEVKKTLEPLGGEVLFFRKWFHRIHRKVLIIDNRVAFIGGVNFGKRFVGWSDLHMRLEGKIAQSMLRSFSYSYKLSGGTDKRLLRLAEKTKFGKFRISMHKSRLAFLAHWPFKGKSVLRAFYKDRIKKAEKSIRIVTPYFVPPHWLLRALKDALDRGVGIEIIVPKISDFLSVDIVTKAFAAELSPLGMKFYVTPTLIHAKVLLIDDKEGLVGSNNIDAQSFDFNVEASVHFNRKDMIGDLRKILDTWRESAELFQEEKHASRWYFKPVEWFVRLFQPIL